MKILLSVTPQHHVKTMPKQLVNLQLQYHSQLMHIPPSSKENPMRDMMDRLRSKERLKVYIHRATELLSPYPLPSKTVQIPTHGSH